MRGWIGVDLDGTLAHYEGWKSSESIGAPIPKMVERVKRWLSEGREVRIFTARVTERASNRDGSPNDVTFVRQRIEAWCKEHIGVVLDITNVKDFDMIELWDDRCVQVQPNTGETVSEFWRHVQ